jgi:hypothetical protein
MTSTNPHLAIVPKVNYMLQIAISLGAKKYLYPDAEVVEEIYDRAQVTPHGWRRIFSAKIRSGQLSTITGQILLRD